MNIRIEKEQRQEGITTVTQKPSKQREVEIKGMTLKEYFRLSENVINRHDQIRETDEEDNCSSKVATPSFNHYNSRKKIKTEVYEEKGISGNKVSYIIKEKPKQILVFQNKTKHLRLDNIPVELPKNYQQKKINKKRTKTFGSVQKQHLNRSTVTSFYHLQEKKKKMLQKVRFEKERAQQMKLSDAFFITKYGGKFAINPKNAF